MSEESHDQDTRLAEFTFDVSGGDGQEDGPPLKLPDSALTVARIYDGIGALIFLGVILGFSQLPFAPGWFKSNLAVICALCLALAALEILVLDPIEHRRYTLRVSSRRLIISKGWIFHQVTIIPRESVLNVRLRRDPLLRKLGLTSVSVLTIASQQTVGHLDAEQTGLIESFASGDARGIHT